jgi:hypothetical protein
MSDEIKKEEKKVCDIDGTKHGILAHKDIHLEKFYVKDWDCNVYIRSMSVKDISNFIKKTKDVEDTQERNLQLILGTVCDKEGKQLFNENDLPALREKSVFTVNVVVAKINRTILKNAQDLEEDAKNL